jgi:hypothetical protein
MAYVYVTLRTAACIYAQEKGPGDAQEAFPSLFFPGPHEDENADSWISVSLWPQSGQVAWSLSSLRIQRYSKTFPHFLHLNSCIGTALTPLVPEKSLLRTSFSLIKK